MFGRATNRLGIGPHSSFRLFFRCQSVKLLTSTIIVLLCMSVTCAMLKVQIPDHVPVSTQTYKLILTQGSKVNSINFASEFQAQRSYMSSQSRTVHTQQLFYGPLSRTTRVSRYQKKHSPTHHPDHHPVFISFFHLPRSVASSLFKLRA